MTENSPKQGLPPLPERRNLRDRIGDVVGRGVEFESRRIANFIAPEYPDPNKIRRYLKASTVLVMVAAFGLRGAYAIHQGMDSTEMNGPQAQVHLMAESDRISIRSQEAMQRELASIERQYGISLHQGGPTIGNRDAMVVYSPDLREFAVPQNGHVVIRDGQGAYAVPCRDGVTSEQAVNEIANLPKTQKVRVLNLAADVVMDVPHSDLADTLRQAQQRGQSYEQ